MDTEIARDELKQKLDHPKKFALIEALPAESYHHAHLPGAINLPPDQVRTLAPQLLPQKDAEVIRVLRWRDLSFLRRRGS